MNNEQSIRGTKNFRNFSIIVTLIGFAILLIGYIFTWVIAQAMGASVVMIGLILLLNWVIKRPIPRQKVDKPISPAEYERGEKDLIEWLKGFVADGYGDKLLHLDFEERRQPTEVLEGLKNHTDQGQADLESYILENRENWREHYSDEEWQASKAKLIKEFSSIDATALDDRYVYFGTETFSYREILEGIKTENEIGVTHILMAASLQKSKQA